MNFCSSIRLGHSTFKNTIQLFQHVQCPRYCRMGFRFCLCLTNVSFFFWPVTDITVLLALKQAIELVRSPCFLCLDCKYQEHSWCTKVVKLFKNMSNRRCSNCKDGHWILQTKQIFVFHGWLGEIF